jgi:hypothetical protein
VNKGTTCKVERQTPLPKWVNIDRTFPLDEAGKALDYQRDLHPRGKIVIKIR